VPHSRIALLALLLAAIASPGVARADAFVWGGHHVGFSEGAGTDGWRTDSARRLAIWGRRISALIPRDRRVMAVLGVDDESFRLEIRDTRGRVLDEMETTLVGFELGSGGYAELARLVAQRFSTQPRPAPPRARAIYTVQLAASPDREAAEALANGLRERGVLAHGSFYFETCAPCFARDPKVLLAEVRGRAVFRVVSGIFDSWAEAEGARARLEGELGHDAFVRRL